jgi:hypothetical protein
VRQNSVIAKLLINYWQNLIARETALYLKVLHVLDLRKNITPSKGVNKKIKKIFLNEESTFTCKQKRCSEKCFFGGKQ